jgi:cytochrome c oxidase subunit III
MPGTSVLEEIEIIIENIGGGGGKGPPARDDDGNGDGGGDERRQPGHSPQRRFSTAIVLVMLSIVMFFMAMSVAFMVLRHNNPAWAPLKLPRILLLNTGILLASSLTLELARRRLSSADLWGFRRFWRVTTALGVLFVLGQLIAWWRLVLAGVYIASNQASSFFYIFTAAHGLHLLGGIVALLYVALRKFEQARMSRKTAALITSYYWHFLDGLWVFLLALLYLGA